MVIRFDVEKIATLFILLLLVAVIVLVKPVPSYAACDVTTHTGSYCDSSTNQEVACISDTNCTFVPACVGGQDITEINCDCLTGQEAACCTGLESCGGGGGGPQCSWVPCQWGDAWNSDPSSHGIGCGCVGSSNYACIPWAWGWNCSCQGGTPGGVTLLSPPNGDQNQVPAGVHLTWQPLADWGYGDCAFTHVKRYWVYVADEAYIPPNGGWPLDAGMTCVNTNDPANDFFSLPATYCDVPNTAYQNWGPNPLTPGHTYQWRVDTQNFFGAGGKSAVWRFKVAYCSINLSPASASIMAGGSQTITANVTPASGVTIKRVDFASGNTNVVTVNPGQDPNSPYQTTARGAAAGTTTISAQGILNDGTIGCSTTSTTDSDVTVTKPVAWWQVKDADVISGGSLNSAIPSSCTSPACDPNFGLAGTGGFPGVPSYTGSYDFSADSSSKGLVSTKGWLVNSPTTFKKVYDYTFFKRQIPSDVQSNIVEITTPSVNGGYFNSGGSPARGYVWYHFNGATYGDLTINGNVNLTGSRKVVLLAEGANINIIGKVNIQSRGNGFFMALAGKAADGSKGNITIDPSVSSPSSPALEGIFFADNKFSTGAGNSWLYLHGTVAALGGVELQRDLADNATQPAEFFEYAPELMTLYPNVFTNRRMNWKEVAP